MVSSGLERQIALNFHELGELLQKKNFVESWTLAGRTQAMLRTDEVLDISSSTLDELKSSLKTYYRLNEDLQTVERKMYALGKKLQEIVE